MYDGYGWIVGRMCIQEFLEVGEIWLYYYHVIINSELYTVLDISLRILPNYKNIIMIVIEIN